MTDVLLFQTPDDGDVDADTGDLALTDGFGTMAYMCMFGGNQEDSGRDGDPDTYWGNLMETNQAFKDISRTQYLLNKLPPSSANLRVLEDAALADLDVFLSAKIANEVTVSASIPARNRVAFAVSIFAEGRRQDFNFVENWEASALAH